MATAGASRVVAVVNQSDFSPSAAAKASPVSETFWSEPTSVMAVTLPPQSPSPFRPVMLMDCSTPSWGQVASMVDTGTDVVQLWLGLHAPGTHTASPASGTPGNAPGLV